jgi:hypothetical protein
MRARDWMFDERAGACIRSDPLRSTLGGIPSSPYIIRHGLGYKSVSYISPRRFRLQ